MSLKKQEQMNKRKFFVNDAVVLRLPAFHKNLHDSTIYPQEVLRAFIKYFNSLYQAKCTFADRFIVDEKPAEGNPGKSHLDLFVYVPGDLTREDFLDDLADFLEDYPDVEGDIIKRWPKANEWNEAHKEEIASGAKKPRQEGIQMAKNAKSAYPKLTLETMLKYIMEEEPENPYPDKSVEELEELEKKKDPTLMEYYKKFDEYDSHEGDVHSLLLTFEREYGHKFNKNDPDDVEDLKLIYNDLYDETLEAQRSWYPADVRLKFNVGEFAPGKEGNVNLLSLYDSKKKQTKDSDESANKQKAFIEKGSKMKLGEPISKVGSYYIFKNEKGEYVKTDAQGRIVIVPVKSVDDEEQESYVDKVAKVLDEWGILYGDIVDYDDRISIVGVDENEWEEVREALESDLDEDISIYIPEEDHPELDDEILVIFNNTQKKNAKYAVILNGEWYATYDTYMEAADAQSRLQAAAETEDDFQNYYGEFPTVEIKEIIRDSVKDADEAPSYDEIGDKLLDKEVIFKDNEYKVEDIEVDDDGIMLTLANDDGEKYISAIQAVINGSLSFKEEGLDQYIKDIAKHFGSYGIDTRVVKKEFAKEKPLKERIEDARKRARADFLERYDVRYKFLLNKLKKQGILDKDESAYLDEYERMKKSAIAKKQRNNQITVNSTYKGNVEELIAWLKKAIVSIDLTTNEYNNKLIIELNERDGTSYDPSFTANKQGDGYVARLTRNPEILAEMPEEVTTWVAPKNTGKSGATAEKVEAPVMVDGKLTSNGIIIDLLTNYGFNVGKQKNAPEEPEEPEEVVEEVKEEVLEEQPAPEAAPAEKHVVKWITYIQYMPGPFEDNGEIEEDEEIEQEFDSLKEAKKAANKNSEGTRGQYVEVYIDGKYYRDYEL